MREQLDSYGRVGVGALVGAAVAALLYGGIALGDETPVDLARHPEVEPVQPGGPSQPQMTSVEAASITSAPPTTTTGSSTTTTTTTTKSTTTTTTTTARHTTTIVQPPVTTTTTHQQPPPPTTTKCHWLIC